MAAVAKHLIDRNRALCNNEHVDRIPQARLGDIEFPCQECRDIAVSLLRAQEIPEGYDLDARLYGDDTHDIVLACRVSMTDENLAFLQMWTSSEKSGVMRASDRPIFLVQTPWRVKHAREGDVIVRYRKDVFDVWRPQRFLARYREL